MSYRYGNSRIINNTKKIESDNNVKYVRRLETVFYPQFDDVEQRQILSQEGDRLDLLAKEYYGDENFWFVIAMANNLGKGSLNVPAGLILKIPFYADEAGIFGLFDGYNISGR